MTTEATTIDAALLQPPAPGAYWPGQGGIYCGTLPAAHGLPARHLVFAATDAPESLQWGGYGIQVEGTAHRWDGRANTAALLAHKATTGTSHPAAEWAAAYTADGHADFHLPAQAELALASVMCPEQFDQAGWYWSSTQTGRNCAFVQVLGRRLALAQQGQRRPRAPCPLGSHLSPSVLFTFKRRSRFEFS